MQKEGTQKRICPLIKGDRPQAGTSHCSNQEPAQHIMTHPVEDPIRNAWIFLRYSLNGPSVSQKEGQEGVVGPKVDPSRWTISTLQPFLKNQDFPLITAEQHLLAHVTHFET